MRLLSPRELAGALGVSESSLKRWVDAGKLTAARTEGGHRKISVAEALRFVRESGAPLAHPELLGMPEVAAALSPLPTDLSKLGEPGQLDGTTSSQQVNRLLAYLLNGDAVGARGWLLGLYLGGTTIDALCDGPIRDAMHGLGELWKHDHAGVFVEHRGTDACLQAISHLRSLVEPEVVPGRPDTRPLAVGCAPEGDPYMIPSFLAATVVASAGMRAVNLGPDTPPVALAAAVAHHKPRLVWISASTKQSTARFNDLAETIASLPAGLTVAIGGRASAALLDAPALRGKKRSRIRPCSSMADLVAVGRATLNR